MRRRQFLHLAAGAAAFSCMAAHRERASLSVAPITMVVPVPAGGALDTNARLVARACRRALGQTVVIENVTGASGSIGTGRVARATPDGYTLSMAPTSRTCSIPRCYNLNYDVVKDFEPIALIGHTPWLIVGEERPAGERICKELVAWLKANPDKATFGTAGQGSPSHIGGVLFQQVTGIELPVHPLSRHRAGDPGPGSRADRHGDPRSDHVAAAVPRRQDQDPRGDGQQSDGNGSQDIPTGTRPACPACTWRRGRACGRPKGTPKDIVAKLNGAVVSALTDPAIRKKFADQSYEPDAARKSDAGLSRQVPQVRDGQVVSDHQGGGDQGRRVMATWTSFRPAHRFLVL